jgi:potassium/hydrogen antiporter
VEEFGRFGLLVFAVAASAGILLLSSQVSARLRVPGAAFFLVASTLVAGFVPSVGDAVSVRTVQRIAVVALIVILFDGGMKVGWHRFRSAVLPIGLLGTVGTVGTAALVAAFGHFLFGFGWTLAWILGAALAPTDPAVMFSVLRGRQLGGRASTVLEGESGVNDAASIALVVVMLEYERASGPSLLVAAREFLVQMGVGVGVGIAAGGVLPFLLRRARFPSEGLYGIAAVVAAALAYGAASWAGGSGFLAVFIVGVLLGAERTPHKGEIDRFSETLASFAEMTVFAALGLTIDLATLTSRGIVADGLVLALLLVIVARPLVVLPLLAPLRLRWGERLFIAWAGMKGATPILLAASAVLAGFESERMYGIVAIVVLFSVIVQGVSVRPVADRFAIPMRGVAPDRKEEPAARKFRVASGSRAAGHALRDIPFGNHAWVTEIDRNGRRLTPRGREVLRPGDYVVVRSDAPRSRVVRRLLEENRRGTAVRPRPEQQRPRAPR